MDVMTDNLAQIMSTWLAANDRRTKSSLSRISGVGDATVGKILRRERSVSVQAAIAIVTAIADQGTAKTFLRDHIRPLRGYLSDVESSPFEQSVDQLIKDRAQFVCYALASTGGTDRQQLRDHLGRREAQKVNELLDAGLLIEGESGWITAKQDHFVVTNAYTLVSQIKYMVETFDFQNIGDPGAIAGVKIASVSTADLVRIQKKFDEFFSEVATIANQSQGPHRMYLGALMNTFEGVSHD